MRGCGADEVERAFEDVMRYLVSRWFFIVDSTALAGARLGYILQHKFSLRIEHMLTKIRPLYVEATKWRHCGIGPPEHPGGPVHQR
jgi:hypothetical protein